MPNPFKTNKPPEIIDFTVVKSTKDKSRVRVRFETVVKRAWTIDWGDGSVTHLLNGSTEDIHQYENVQPGTTYNIQIITPGTIYMTSVEY